MNFEEKGYQTVYAVKVEDSETDNPQLSHEARIYQILSGGVGIVNCYAYENTSDHIMLVMDMLGDDLHTLFKNVKKAFQLKRC